MLVRAPPAVTFLFTNRLSPMVVPFLSTDCVGMGRTG